MDIYNIKLEFDHKELKRQIDERLTEKGKGYVCVVDGNVLKTTLKDATYRDIVYNAYTNTCDGSSLAMMANHIYGKSFRALSGPDIFREYIEKPYTQLLIGNTEKRYGLLKNILENKGMKSSKIKHLGLPFEKVEDFDYESIGKVVNEISPAIIWVSLGAPKQEQFMARLLPYINQGLMFGIGAAVNYYIGEIKKTSLHVGSLNLTWLQRQFQEPKKQLKRMIQFLMVMPKIYFQENKRAKNTLKKVK